MSKATELGLGILGSALVLGIVMDALLQPALPGINVVLCLLAVVAVITILARWKREAITGEGRWLLLPALFFGAAFAWRDSPTLQLVNGLGLATALALAALRMRSGRISGAGLADYLLGAGVAVVQAAAGHFPLLFQEIQWKEVPRGRWCGTLFGISRGVVIAVPLLLLFGGLFASADAVFDQRLQRLFHWDFSSLASHGLMIALYSLAAAGFLRRALAADEWKSPERERFSSFTLGALEIGVVLVLLNLLFLAFVDMQFRFCRHRRAGSGQPGCVHRPHQRGARGSRPSLRCAVSDRVECGRRAGADRGAAHPGGREAPGGCEEGPDALVAVGGAGLARVELGPDVRLAGSGRVSGPQAAVDDRRQGRLGAGPFGAGIRAGDAEKCSPIEAHASLRETEE